ncbi:AfsR/SARP family transcriptional regulator [Nonomuraea zeae]|uniref:AfsR/SARP family transcriptional regulator n=2 Tax=Nonomuraea zeae TaxID=1642303 RepID=A0A5S4GUS2_9ACTN|nr:AfsR/SARP family transcriptional regulator [Nonomuraea zeae]TMR36705.1 AfsR/SARP family transcriptional regulator [Nonomuraea zeae]
MEIKLLGPMEASESGISILPSAGKPRQILALLALNSGQIVTSAILAEELWRGRPPRMASTTLQTYILQLRRNIDRAQGRTQKRTAKDVLVTRHTGYQLLLPDDRVDAFQHEHLVAAGRQAAAGRDDEKASELFSAALKLWRGAPLVDVPTGTPLQLEVMRLEQHRMVAVELWIETELRLGRHQGLLGELAVLCAQQPLNESLQTSYMVALYRSGRQWQALTVYRTLCATLRRELQVQPCPRTQRIVRAITENRSDLDDFPGSMVGAVG